MVSALKHKKIVKKRIAKVVRHQSDRYVKLGRVRDFDHFDFFLFPFCFFILFYPLCNGAHPSSYPATNLEEAQGY